ncbi:MAG TPA: phosphatidate cytidylyltransferase [Leptolyngbyaceae cyanobacterium M33_DOE_097]|nr:phosphatidate cytidylyltransferase [Leptolyngbyaceae cyanobacterium M33_DOE_097]
MHPIFVYISLFLFLGAIGMHYGNRKVDTQTGQKRWLKFLTYIVIVSTVLAGIFLDRFDLVAIFISVVGLGEIIKIITKLSSRWFQLLIIVIYVAITFGFIYFSTSFDRSLLLFIYFQVFTFDGFSQVVGQLLGKQKLLPQISPGKTLEGLVGGTVFCVLSALLARNWVAFSMPKALLLGLTTASLAFVGDILASYLKRRCHVKDYSTLLPGHGGFLDRFDSLMMVGVGYSLLSQLRSLQ